jgi:hypothetical protein
MLNEFSIPFFEQNYKKAESIFRRSKKFGKRSPI